MNIGRVLVWDATDHFFRTRDAIALRVGAVTAEEKGKVGLRLSELTRQRAGRCMQLESRMDNGIGKKVYRRAADAVAPERSTSG
jgi:hypothetical protein